MAVVLCDICNQADSKYKCPACGLRYCSLICYKPHKAQHQVDDTTPSKTTTPPDAAPATTSRIDRPGTTRRIAKQTFTGFEHDEEFKRLLVRYPKLQAQLQGIYALTLDPGPDEERAWNRPHLPMIERSIRGDLRGGRGSSGGGRGRFMTRGRGGRNATPWEPPEGRERGRWSRDKGTAEALFVMRKVQDESSKEDLSDGLKEFVELVSMRYGQ